MPDITITLSDAQAKAVTSANGGAYPTDEEFLEAYLAPVCDGWAKSSESATDAKLLAALKAADEADTKSDIIAEVEGK